MAGNVDNIILEQLRLLREDMNDMRQEVNGRFDKVEASLSDVEHTQQGMQAILIGLGQYIGSIDHRVEALEDKIGGDQ